MASFSPNSPQNRGDISRLGWIFDVVPIAIGVEPLAKKMIHVHEKSYCLKYVDVSNAESIINRKSGLKRGNERERVKRCFDEQDPRKGQRRQEMIMKCRYRHREMRETKSVHRGFAS